MKVTVDLQIGKKWTDCTIEDLLEVRKSILQATASFIEDVNYFLDKAGYNHKDQDKFDY